MLTDELRLCSAPLPTMLRIAGDDALRPGHERVGLWQTCFHKRHCEERSDEAIQTASAERFWIASLRSQ